MLTLSFRSSALLPLSHHPLFILHCIYFGIWHQLWGKSALQHNYDQMGNRCVRYARACTKIIIYVILRLFEDIKPRPSLPSHLMCISRICVFLSGKSKACTEGRIQQPQL